jgi:hypothetical protein
MSDDPDGLGGYDIWVATRATQSDPWNPATNLGPSINSEFREGEPQISGDGLSLYFDSDRPGGYGNHDIWVTTRKTKSDPWEEPVNLGPAINTTGNEWDACARADDLELYFCRRPEGTVVADVWVATRPTREEVWTEAISLPINVPEIDCSPYVCPDGLTLLFTSTRPGGRGSRDIWTATRLTADADWTTPTNHGAPLNSAAKDDSPSLSADLRMLYFSSERSGGHGTFDICQIPVITVVDFNADGAVDILDTLVMVEDWGIVGTRGGPNTNFCDIAPLPFGDGIVDAKDLRALAEHMIEDAEGASNQDGNE